MSWRMADYICDSCGALTTDHLAQYPLPETLLCPCGQQQRQIMGAPMVLKASYPDGSGRLDHLREQRKLRREERRVVRAGDKAGMQKVQEEKRKLGSFIKADKAPE